MFDDMCNIDHCTIIVWYSGIAGEEKFPPARLRAFSSLRKLASLCAANFMSLALKVFQHDVRTKQHQLFPSAPIQYGAKTQYANERSTAPLLDAKGEKIIQQVCGKFLFLGHPK